MIKVRSDHIKEGITGCGLNCPIALAVKEYTNDPDIRVYPSYLHCMTPLNEYMKDKAPILGKYYFSDSLRSRITKFDIGEGFGVDEFILAVDKNHISLEVD